MRSPTSSFTGPRRLGLAAALACGALACGSLLACGGERMRLPSKATPATARLYVEFESSPEFVQAYTDRSAEQLQGDPAFVTQFTETARGTGARMTAVMRGELPHRRIGQVVVSPDAPHDLALTGTFRIGPSSIDLDWTLVERETGTIVVAGVASETWFTGAVEGYADQVLARLLATDVDRYARSAPTAPRPTPNLGTPPASATDGRRAFAVVVGIERYREALPEATHAENDARAFAAYAERTLGVPPAHIKLLTGTRAGRADLASAFEEWLPRNVTGPGDTVYVFFSGHGAPDPETGVAYLVPWDADPAYLKTRGLAVDALYRTLADLGAGRVVVALDACFSGSGERSVLAAGTRPLVPVAAPAAKGALIALAAAGPRETTGAAGDAPHGLFTRHLLAGLAGAADADGDRSVSLAELTEHVRARVEAEARLDNRTQTPTSRWPSTIDPRTEILVRGLRPK